MLASIETIWKKSQPVSNEKLEKFMHRKESESQDVLQGLMRKYQLNRKWVGVGAVLSILIFPILATPNFPLLDNKI